MNKGNGADFFQFGRFDRNTGNFQNVNTLDGQSTCFSVTGENENIPPVATGIPQDNTVELQCDEIGREVPISFAAPENNDTVTVVLATGVSTPGVSVSIDNDGSQTATAVVKWEPSTASSSSVSVQLVATDSFGATTEVGLTFTSPGPCTGSPTKVPTLSPTVKPVSSLM